MCFTGIEDCMAQLTIQMGRGSVNKSGQLSRAADNAGPTCGPHSACDNTRPPQ